MRIKKINIFLPIFLLFCIHGGFAQNPLSIKATVDRKEILVGEPIQLILEVSVPLGSDVGWFSLDSIPHFEFVDRDKIDSVTTPEQKTFRQHIVITSFDSGSNTIPSLPVLIDHKTYITDSIHIEVSYSKFDPTKDYHDIKDIIAVENPYAKYIIWGISFFTLLSIAMVIWLINIKKPFTDEEEEEIIVSRLSPYEEAVKSLEELRKQKLPETGQVKLYYIRLNDILRLFVLRKLQIGSLEKTNEELILQLKQLNMLPDHFSQLAQSLRMSDFVKFAKYLPGDNDNERNFKVIEASIELLNKIEK